MIITVLNTHNNTSIDMITHNCTVVVRTTLTQPHTHATNNANNTHTTYTYLRCRCRSAGSMSEDLSVVAVEATQ